MERLGRMMIRANTARKYQRAPDYAVRIGGIDTSAVRGVVWRPDLVDYGENVNDTAYIGSGAFRDRHPGILLSVIQHEVRHSEYPSTREGHAQIYEADLSDAERFRLPQWWVRDIEGQILRYRPSSGGLEQ
jgi:hypothetical protein